TIADDLAVRAAGDPDALYRVATLYAACRTVVVRGRQPGPPDETARGLQAAYAQGAIRVLGRAVDHGFRDADRLRDTALIGLSREAGFQALIERILRGPAARH